MEEHGWERDRGVLRPVFSPGVSQMETGEHPPPAHMPLELQGDRSKAAVSPPTNGAAADRLLLGADMVKGSCSLASPAIISAPGNLLSVYLNYKRQTRDFPGGPVSKAPCSQCRGPGVRSLVRDVDPTCCN